MIKEGNPMQNDLFRSAFLTAAVVAMTWPIAACGATGIQGTYSNQFVVLELKAGGKCTLNAAGEPEPDVCTWHVEGNKITVNANRGLPVEVFTIHDDGSLTAGDFGTLQKTK
jgi:hypothetical protein